MSILATLISKIDKENLWQKEVKLERNEYLKVKGSTDTNLYYVKNGSLRIFLLDEEEEQTIRFGYKNNLITALDSFLNDQPSDFYIQALKKTTVKVLTKQDYLAFINASFEHKEIWNEILKSFVLQQMERERDILTTSPVERYRRVLKRSPQLFQEIPNKYIASYLRMTPETLSRIKKS